MVCGYSRWMSAVLLPSRQAADLLAGHWLLLQRLGAVPKALAWDNESAVGSWRAGRSKLADAFEGFRGTLGIRMVQCRPGDPEAKGLVERANGYLETSFLPGRTFTSPTDFNGQLEQWLERANSRQHRTLGCRPADRLEADRTVMLSLPPVPPSTGWASSVRLPRDHYVRLDSNDYSVHPPAVGRLIELRADLQTVTVTLVGRDGGRLVARHERCWADHRTITDLQHQQAAADLRRNWPPSADSPSHRGRTSSSGRARRLRRCLRPRRSSGGGLMAIKTAAPVRDLAAEVAFLTRALKAPTLRDCVERLAERARTEG